MSIHKLVLNYNLASAIKHKSETLRVKSLTRAKEIVKIRSHKIMGGMSISKAVFMDGHSWKPITISTKKLTGDRLKSGTQPYTFDRVGEHSTPTVFSCIARSYWNARRKFMNWSDQLEKRAIIVGLEFTASESDVLAAELKAGL